MTLPDDVRAVLDFWFGVPGDATWGQPRPAWFQKNDAFDAEIAARFGGLIERALAGGLQAWGDGPHTLAALAEIVVLDQFTRNTLRGRARAFAGDPRALQVARVLVASGRDRELTGVQRQFAYLPFEHAEDRAHQRTAVQLFEQLERDCPEVGELHRWAVAHQVIVERFGRFPHRNAALGRASTPEEIEFLKQPGSSF